MPDVNLKAARSLDSQKTKRKFSEKQGEKDGNRTPPEKDSLVSAFKLLLLFPSYF